MLAIPVFAARSTMKALENRASEKRTPRITTNRHGAESSFTKAENDARSIFFLTAFLSSSAGS